MNHRILTNLIPAILITQLWSCGKSAAPTSQLAGSNSVGNGGGAWVCWGNQSEQSVTWAKLVDLYEAEREYKLTLQTFASSNYQEIVQAMKLRVFEASNAFYGEIAENIDHVMAKMQLVDADLGPVNDANYRVVPALRECDGGYIARQPKQLANYTNDNRILVNQFVWNSSAFSPADRAALVFHEAIYAYLRKSRGDTTSDEARRLTGYIFSTASRGDLSRYLEFHSSTPNGSCLKIWFNHKLPEDVGECLLGSNGRDTCVKFNLLGTSVLVQGDHSFFTKITIDEKSGLEVVKINIPNTCRDNSDQWRSVEGMTAMIIKSSSDLYRTIGN